MVKAVKREKVTKEKYQVLMEYAELFRPEEEVRSPVFLVLLPSLLLLHFRLLHFRFPVCLSSDFAHTDSPL